MLRGQGSSTTTGLRLRPGVPFEDWLALGQRISDFASGSSWWLGDWLVYGEREYRGRYKAALEATSLDYQTLRNYAWVARRFEPSRRRDTLSFQHHADLAALPATEQDAWLERAQRQRWSRNELRRQLAEAARSGIPPGEDRPAETRPVVLRLELAAVRMRRWREAARTSGLDLTEWLASAADQVADSALTEAPQPPVRQLNHVGEASARRRARERYAPGSARSSRRS